MPSETAMTTDFFSCSRSFTQGEEGIGIKGYLRKTDQIHTFAVLALGESRRSCQPSGVSSMISIMVTEGMS